MLRIVRPSAREELDVDRAVRRWKVKRSINLLSQIALGLGLGCLVAEAYTWARTANWGSPLIFELYRALHIKLPHSNWAGIARVIDWLLVQPLVLCAGALLLTLAAMLRFLATMLGRRRLPTISERLKPKPPVLLPVAPDQRTLLIEEAYRKLDAVDTISKPVRHPSIHQ